MSYYVSLPILAVCLLSTLEFRPGKVQYLVTMGLIGLVAAAGEYLQLTWLFPLIAIPTALISLFFYATAVRHPVNLDRPWQILLVLFISYTLLGLLPLRLALSLAVVLALIFLWQSQEMLNAWVLMGYLLLQLGIYLINEEPLFMALSFLSFALTYALSIYTREKQAKEAEARLESVLAAYAEEVQASHLQMRAWRHDFHNHLQSMRYYLQEDRTAELATYLTELQSDLASVDTMVKTGHLSLDAVLNSKLSLAKAAKIALDITVFPLPKISISDVDLTALIGNLLDNAIEACEKIPQERRFIRLYLDCEGEQLYLSIHNAAKEVLSFNERNYISNKRGRHGLGMKRVAMLVEKYGGFLNLQNEAGVFAAELTFALPAETETAL
ncbi:MAG: GHKL domain-containing protein [Eubacteriales bacterium]|nr:GHKL domain-containing protein [Eubacteriales bacterium]